MSKHKIVFHSYKTITMKNFISRRYSSYSVIILLFSTINSSSTIFAQQIETTSSQPALIPTYDRSGNGKTSQKNQDESTKSNVYSESLEILTTTTPLFDSKYLNSTTDYSSKQNFSDSLPEENSVKIDSNFEPKTIEKNIQTYHDELTSNKFDYQTDAESLKPEAYLESIVNPEPYAKLLEFDEKSKEKPDVKVTIYHHQGISDPISNYGSGKPWNFYGTGYGIHYEHNKDGSYGREKGYQFEKAHGREFCDKKNCQDKGKHSQQLQQTEESSREVKKTPIQNHVEGLLNHNNIDIQRWYREGDIKPEVKKINISQVKQLPDSSYSTLQTFKPEIQTQKPPSTTILHKISEFLPKSTPPPIYLKPQVEYPRPYNSNSETKSNGNFVPISSSYSNFNLNNRPQMNYGHNRYSFYHKPNHYPHQTPSYYSNNNYMNDDYQNFNFQNPVSNDNIFNIDTNLWATKSPQIYYNTEHRKQPLYGSSTYMPKYTTYHPYNNIKPIYKKRSMNGWNPYS